MKKYWFKRKLSGFIQALLLKKVGAGFTLIELLVVMFIIAILATLIIINLNAARAKARDSQRKSDLHTLRNALENYADNYSFYPDEISYRSMKTPADPGLPDTCTEGNLWCARAALSLAGNWPEDPRGYPTWDKFKDPTTPGTDYYNYGYCARINGSGYILGASLESGNAAHKLWGYRVSVNPPTAAIPLQACLEPSH